MIDGLPGVLCIMYGIVIFGDSREDARVKAVPGRKWRDIELWAVLFCEIQRFILGSRYFSPGELF